MIIESWPRHTSSIYHINILYPTSKFDPYRVHFDMSLPSSVPAAVSAEYNANLAAARASGIASNAFPTRDNQGILPLSLPPEGFFPSFDSLKSAACKHAKLAGWCIVIGRGSKVKNGRNIKYLVCKHAYEHDGRGLNTEDRKRDRQSKKTNCLVKMKVNERLDGSWELRWMEGRQEHNHDVKDPASYHEHRRLNEAQQRIVHANHAAGITAARTKVALQADDPDIEIISRDLFNKTAQMAREMRRGKEPNQALVDELNALKERGELIFEYAIDPDTRRIQKIFIADGRQVALQMGLEVKFKLIFRSKIGRFHTLTKTRTFYSWIVHIRRTNGVCRCLTYLVSMVLIKALRSELPSLTTRQRKISIGQ
jgi:hypothetical protein